MNPCLWFNYNNDSSSQLLAVHLSRMLGQKKFKKMLKWGPPVFLCIGTPKIPGDCLGPMVGSLLSLADRYPVFGTMARPVHAQNIRTVRKYIRRKYPRSLIIVIDASIGSTGHSGFLTLKKGPLRPGLGLGKRLPPVGHIQITGVFEDLYGNSAQKQMIGYGLCICQSLFFLNTKLCIPSAIRNRLDQTAGNLPFF